MIATAAVALRRRQRASPAALAGLVFGATLLAGPISEVHYLLSLAAIALVVLGEANRPRDLLALATGVGMLLLPGPVWQLLLDRGEPRQTWFLVAELMLFAGFGRVAWVSAATIPAPVVVTSSAPAATQSSAATASR